MRHDTRAALQKLREDIEAKVASYSSDNLIAYSMHCGAMAMEIREYATALAKILEHDAHEDRQDSKT